MRPGSQHFVGFANYAQVFSDSQFWTTALNTVVMTVGTVLIAMVIGVGLALLPGQLQQFASPTALYDRPANVFVASFIGSPAMNRFDATAERDGIRLGSVLLRPSDAQLRAVQGHSKLVAGIRPEHLSIGDGQLTVQVALVEDLGSDSYIYGHLADDPASSVIIRSGRQHPRPGDVMASVRGGEGIKIQVVPGS